MNRKSLFRLMYLAVIMSGVEPTQIPIAMNDQLSANALYRQTVNAASRQSDAVVLTLTLPVSAVDALQSAIDEAQPDYTMSHGS